MFSATCKHGSLNASQVVHISGSLKAISLQPCSSECVGTKMDPRFCHCLLRRGGKGRANTGGHGCGSRGTACTVGRCFFSSLFVMSWCISLCQSRGGRHEWARVRPMFPFIYSRTHVWCCSPETIQKHLHTYLMRGQRFFSAWCYVVAGYYARSSCLVLPFSA